MNTRSAIIALLLALLVAGGAIWLLRPEPQVAAPEPRTWLATLDPMQVNSLKVQWKDGRAVDLERSPMPDLWLLKTKGGSWPVSGKRVQAALARLADIDGAPTADQTKADAATITVRVGATDHRFSISDAILGGKAAVRIEGEVDRYRLVDAQISRMFASEGLRAWREPSAFSTQDFSRIKLSTIGRQVVLGKVAGRWGVQVPVVAPGDQETCAQLGALLAGLKLSRFIDDAPGTDEALGLASPQAVIDTETDFRIARGGEVERRVLIQQLKIGGPVDAAQDHLFASLRAQWLDPTTRAMSPAWGPVLAAVSRADLEKLTAELPVYVSKQSVQAAAPDVSVLMLYHHDDAMQDKAPPAETPTRRVKIERYLETRDLTLPAAASRAPSPQEAAAIEGVLKLLCEQPAAAIGREPPAGTMPVMRLKVQATGASEDIGLGVATLAPPSKRGELPQPPEPAVILRVGGIYRVYFGKVAIDAAEWLNDILPPEG